MLISLIVPCYNEEEAMPLFYKEASRVAAEMKASHGAEFEFIFVDDGSRDGTLRVARALHAQDPRVRYVSFSRNFGKEAGIYAGLQAAKGDYVATMDADLQDDVDACDAMIERYMAGCDIVYGVRRHRATDTFFKRTTALGFYKIMNALGANTVYNHADYRLMRRRALEGLAEFSEVNLFLRGIVPMIGYPSDVVYYDRKERAAGESKYPLKKMLAFAIEGITSLSTKPIRMITFMGIAAFFVSIGFLIWAVVDFFRGNTITGWASMMVSLWFIGGLLLLSVGIVGEYVGKIYLESKHRPRYIIESRTPDRIREREKGRSRKQEMPGENLRRSRAEARELQTSKRREAVQKPEQE